MRRPARLLVVLSIVIVGASGCSTDPMSDVPAQLLQGEDLPAVERVRNIDGRNATAVGCGQLDVEYNIGISDPEPVGRYITLKSGDVVVTSVIGRRIGFDDVSESLDQVAQAITECEVDSVGEFRALEDLPADAVGFQEVLQTSHNDVTTQRAYARVSDDRAVVVTVVHEGDGRPSVTVEELLPLALERAAP